MKIGFIGGGNMAYAILSGGLSGGVLTASHTNVSDPSDERRKLVSSLGVSVTESNEEVCLKSDYIFLCIKPQQLNAVLEPLKSVLDPKRHCLVSILAGAPTRRLEALLADGLPVVRVMPNTPMLVGKGVSAVCAGKHAISVHISMVSKILESCSTVLTIDESMMDAVTAVSGSGPAYLFYLAEAMTDAAKSVGFDDKTADLLVRGTLAGSSELLAGSEKTAAELRAMVTSKGGTTAAAISVFDQSIVKDVVIRAIKAARDRSVELGKG